MNVRQQTRLLFVCVILFGCIINMPNLALQLNGYREIFINITAYINVNVNWFGDSEGHNGERCCMMRVSVTCQGPSWRCGQRVDSNSRLPRPHLNDYAVLVGFYRMASYRVF